MNLFEPTEDSSGEVLFVNFNQDCTSLAVGTKKGYKLYSFNHLDELEVIHTNEVEDIRIIERLFSSSLVALVTISSPRKLKVCHFKKGTEICNYSYSNTILAVKLNRQRLVVCLVESLYIHNIRDMKVLHTIRDTPPNPAGLCVLSISNEHNFLAYPGSSSIGEVQIFDALNLQAKSMIPAHDNPLAAMAFDPTGTKLATASEKGTVIRVFNVLDGTKLYEFRRGVKRCVRIYSLSFSEDSRFLSASSNTETVHIFRLDELKDIKPSEEPQSWLGYFGKAIVQSASVFTHSSSRYAVPRKVICTCPPSIFGSKEYSVPLPCEYIITFNFKFLLNRSISTPFSIDKIPRVLVVSGEGILYILDLEPVEGGDCTLVKTHNLLDSSEESLDGSRSKDAPEAPADSPSARRPFQPESEQEGRALMTAQNDYENDFPPMVSKVD
ncbi:WD repeat domain phosphoinositide-interacting protein 2 [Araneus ventricosus]|uniref:WD repeat domain phosphoinositide-interacting protein 2 n=1 Tax=Araneus ventricosus TaxID=182803 RepID=A0A4Y2I5L6_ARAVE|nr:WD repeat domain phosphoinositide-interacting protein 2 [Araneus ventricosus]